MSLNGVWSSEIHGVFDWERWSIAVLRDGSVVTGSKEHYSLGTYTVSGETVEMTADVYFYSTPRTLFGESEKQYSVKFEGKRDGDVIKGSVWRPDKPGMTVEYRLTRRADLP